MCQVITSYNIMYAHTTSCRCVHCQVYPDASLFTKCESELLRWQFESAAGELANFRCATVLLDPISMYNVYDLGALTSYQAALMRRTLQNLKQQWRATWRQLRVWGRHMQGCALCARFCSWTTARCGLRPC